MFTVVVECSSAFVGDMARLFFQLFPVTTEVPNTD